jgi:hypothetical protein
MDFTACWVAMAKVLSSSPMPLEQYFPSGMCQYLEMSA